MMGRGIVRAGGCGEFERVFFWVINFKMSERSLMNWANLEASIKFPTDLLDPNSHFSKCLHDAPSNSQGILRPNEEEPFSALHFGLENTVNFCDVVARLPLTADGPHFGS